MFEQAITKLLQVEGGYVNDPADRGGETNFGITVALARAHGYTGPMKDLPLLTAKAIYKKEFWDSLRLDEISSVYPSMAEELFDSCVNIGKALPSKWFQTGLNSLNKNQTLWKNITVDGAIGPATIALFRSMTPADRVILYKIVNILQGAHYINLSQREEVQERFIRGWLTRVNFV